MVGGDFLLRQILIFVTVDGVLSQWPTPLGDIWMEPSGMMGGSLDMMGGGGGLEPGLLPGLEPGPMSGLEPGMMGGMGDLPFGGGMNGPGIPPGRGMPEYQELPFQARPLAARMAQRQWNARPKIPTPQLRNPKVLNPQTVTEKPKKYKFPDGRPAQNGQDKNAWKKLKSSLDRTLTAFPNGLRRRPNQNQGRFQQNRVQNNNVRQSGGSNNQVRQQRRPPQNQQFQRQQMTRQNNNNIQGSGFRNLRPVGPQPARNVFQGRSPMPLKNNFPQRTLFTQPRPQVVTPLPRNLAKGRPMLPSMLPQGSAVPIRQPLTMTSQNNAMQSSFVSQQSRQMNTFPAMNNQGSIMSAQTSIQGISQANAKPLATVNRFPQAATQPGIYDTRGVKAPPGYMPIIPNTPTAPRKKPMIESMRKAVQNGEQIMGNSSKSSTIASSNKNTSTLEALTQAAEGPSLKNVKVQPNSTLRPGIPSTLAPIVTTPRPVTMYGVTQDPYMDAYGTNSWGMAPTTNVYGSYYSGTGTQGLYDPYNFATDIPRTLHYSHQSNLDIRQSGARNPIPTGQEHQRLLQQQELRQKQLQYERQQQQMMIHRQQYEKQYIAKQQQYMQAITSKAPTTERPTTPLTTSASLRRSEKVPVAVQMVTSTLTVPTQPPPTSTTVPTPTTTKKIETTTVPALTTTQAQTTTRIASTQQGTDPSTRIPPPGVEDRIGVRPNNVDPNPDPNGPRPTQPIVPQSPTVSTSTTIQGNTGASAITSLETEAPLVTATITPDPSNMTTEGKPTTNTNPGTSSTIVSSTTPPPTSPTVTKLITKPPVLTTTNQDLTNAPSPLTEGQNNVIDKNKLSVPAIQPDLAQQPSKPRGIQQNGIPMEQDPPYSQPLPAYHLANAPQNQVNNQIGNSLTVAQENQIFNLPSGSGVNVNTQQGNFGMLTIQQQQRSQALPMVGRMQSNNLQQSPVPYNTLPFSQRNSLLGQGTLSQSNVMRQNVRSAVQPRFTGPMTMQQRGSVPQSGFRGMNQNVPYQNPAMRQGLQVDSTIYQNPSQLGNRSRFSQMSPNLAQTNVAGGAQAHQMSFSRMTQRYPGQSMNQNRRWLGNPQAGPRGLSAQGHSKHSARLSNRPNPDMSLLTVMQRRGALFRSTTSSTAIAKAGHLAMTLSKSKNQVAVPKVESLKQNSESPKSTKAEKDPNTTTMITPKPTTTGSTTVQSTGDTSTTTHIPRMSQGNLVISQKVAKHQSNTTVDSKSQPESRRIKDPRNEGNLNIIQRQMKGGMYPTTTPSPRDIISESNQELSKRLNGQLYVAQRRRILPPKLRPRLRTLDVTLPNKNAMNAPSRMGKNLLRTQNQLLTSNIQSNALQQRQLLAQRSRQNLAANRRQISPPSSFVQSRTPTINKLHSQISRRNQGPLLASGTATQQSLVRPSPMPIQRRNQNQLQRHSPRVQGQASTSGQGLVQKRVQGQRLNPQRVQGQRLTQTRNQGQRQILTRNQSQRQAPVQGPSRTQTIRGQRQGNNLPRVQGQRHNFARTQGMRQTLPRAQVPRRVPNRVQSAAVQRSPLKSMQVSRRQFPTPGVGLGMQKVGPVYRPVFAQTRMQTTSGNVIPRGPIHRLRPQAPTNIRPGVFRARG